jgi:UDP-N-acetylglucosamine--N-acetylmuramyl-(pentapeptide) pyrophosphoryl-undecaprenol N-acetylglucosamine transferase
MKKRIIFSGGGTGGHIYPALAIKEKLEESIELEAAYVGVIGGLEEKILSREKNIAFLGVRAQGMPRSLSLKWFSFPFTNLKGIYAAYKHLKAFKPELVVTTGGYVAFPVLAAARLLGIPFVIHEQNAAMGVTNRLFAGSAKKILLTYEAAASAVKGEAAQRIVVTGNPVRSSFFKKATANQGFRKETDELVIAAVGGSRGALSLNKACIDLVNHWLPKNPKVRLIHISGERDYEMVKAQIKTMPENYSLLPYHHEMKEIFDAADLLISRAGATILAEISVCKKPAILIPFPFATDNHQEKNARTLENLQAARVLLDKNLSLETLAPLLDELNNKSELEKMSKAMETSRPKNVEETIFNEILAVFEKP